MGASQSEQQRMALELVRQLEGRVIDEHGKAPGQFLLYALRSTICAIAPLLEEPTVEEVKELERRATEYAIKHHFPDCVDGRWPWALMRYIIDAYMAGQKDSFV